METHARILITGCFCEMLRSGRDRTIEEMKLSQEDDERE
jgi:hypothetical protein